MIDQYQLRESTYIFVVHDTVISPVAKLSFFITSDIIIITRSVDSVNLVL